MLKCSFLSPKWLGVSRWEQWEQLLQRKVNSLQHSSCFVWSRALRCLPAHDRLCTAHPQLGCVNGINGTGVAVLANAFHKFILWAPSEQWEWKKAGLGETTEEVEMTSRTHTQAWRGQHVRSSGDVCGEGCLGRYYRQRTALPAGHKMLWGMEVVLPSGGSELQQQWWPMGSSS